MTLAAVFTGLCVLCVLALLAAERRGSRRGVLIAKPAASASFLGLALALMFGQSAPPAYAYFVLAGLVLGAGGDVALMLRSERAFLVGLGLFLAGHFAYAGACATLVSPASWISLTASAPMAGALLALAYLAPHVSASMRLPVVVYVATITTMLIAAIAVVRAAPLVHLDASSAYLLGGGAGLFFVSDLAVARDKFVAPGFGNKLWGLPAYFAGQLLIAWTI